MNVNIKLGKVSYNPEDRFELTHDEKKEKAK